MRVVGVSVGVVPVILVVVLVLVVSVAEIKMMRSCILLAAVMKTLTQVTLVVGICGLELLLTQTRNRPGVWSVSWSRFLMLYLGEIHRCCTM